MDTTTGRLSTGNRFVVIPDLLKSNGGILNISFAYMLYRSIVELSGTPDEPFLEADIRIDGRPIDNSKGAWKQLLHWIPSFDYSDAGVNVSYKVFAPLAHRGLVWVIDLESKADKPVTIDAGWKGKWLETDHIVGRSKPMRGDRVGGINKWYNGVPFVEFRGIAPVFGVSFCPSESMETCVFCESQPERVISSINESEATAHEGDAICYQLTKSITLGPGEQKSIALYIGLGLEEVSAVSSAVDLRHHSWETLYSELTAWLESHRLSVNDEHLNDVLNLNSFYNFFFSEAVTVDTEELVLTSARSSKYAACGAYWDRDAMLWSLPAVLQIDSRQARRMIEYALTVQLRNVGVHSRFIDGVAFEPGFELDELCAPIRALAMYVRSTADISILFDRRVQTGVNRIHKTLISKKHPTLALFETMLQPSDAMARYPYVTYDNVLAWRVLRDLEWMYELIHDLDRSDDNKQLAKQVQKAIMSNCLVDGPFGPMFAWSVDLEGNYVLGDEPAGSLQLLSWLEFCSPDLPAYQNTVAWIHSPENPYSFHKSDFVAPGIEHEGHPSLMSVINDLLTGRQAHAIEFLKRAALDDGIACETVDERTGKVASGPAFASCAGYLAFALSSALGGQILQPELEPTDKLYVPPPSELHEGIDPGAMH